MNFDFSDDQQQLRDAVQKWVARSYTFDKRRAAVKAGGLDRAAYAELAELGHQSIRNQVVGQVPGVRVRGDLFFGKAAELVADHFKFIIQTR